MGRAERKELVKNIEDHRHSRVICCLTSDRQNATGVLAKDFIPIFYSHLQKFDTLERIDVFLFTLGGDTLAAFGLCRHIREFVGDFGCLIPERCHSGGTLIALGANEIVMTKAATLSPIDPSVTGAFNPQVEPVPGQRQIVPVSVESVAGFKELVKDWKLDGDGISSAFRLLADKINPLLLGDVYRSRENIPILAEKLLRSHRSDVENIGRIIEELTRKLSPHDYPISRSEARLILGSQVHPDDPELESLLWRLFADFSVEMELGRPYDPNVVLGAAETSGAGPGKPLKVTQQVVVIESTAARDVWERSFNLSRVQVNTPAGPVLSVAQQLLYGGWRHE
jgi:hypothetical protein